MSEHRMSLDGMWDFQVDSGGGLDASLIQTWRSAVVPMPWQAQFEDLRQSGGVVWYRRQFTLEPGLLGTEAGGAAILHFGAVDYQAVVWVNGQRAGEHAGGYLPFEFDVVDLLHAGDNELLVRVVDIADEHGNPGVPFSQVPHGKQSWYGPVGGIWQSVWLEMRPLVHITRISVAPSPGDAAIAVQVVLSQTLPADGRIVCTVTGPDRQPAGSATLGQSAAGREVAGVIRLDDTPRLWSPESPNLYTVTATLVVGGESVHAVQKTCGFRTVEARDGRIYLNGEPIYLRGMLDQGYFPETIYTPPSLELLETQAQAAKALGFNCLRIHIKVEDPRYYDVADRLGLLVWTEIPNWALLTDDSAERARQTFHGMVERDGHHPSIIAWTLINENWGTDLSRNAMHRRWLADFYRDAKQIDPTRLVVDNSACCDNAHVASDLEDFHHYRAIPDHADKWDDWVGQFAGRPDWSWYPDFEGERRSDLPLLVSEFGNWGLPDPAAIREHDAEPWWFETGFDWGGGIVYPHGVEHRFAACGLADLFSSYADFARHSQAHMARSLHYEISSMRLYDAIAGYVVTEFTDVHWECNGLLTMQRQPKHLLDPLLKDLNQDRVIVLRPNRWSAQPGQELDVLMQAMGVLGKESRGVIRWRAGSRSGQLPAPGGSVPLTLDSPGVVTLVADWLSEDGSRLATNQIDLVFVAAPPAFVPLYVVDNPALAATLRELGYSVRTGESDTAVVEDEILVACRYTRSLETYVQGGGRLLLLADSGNSGETGSGEPAVPLPVGHVTPRAGTPWEGDWATSFAWVNKQGPLDSLPGGPLLEMEWARLTPDAVITGLPPWVQRNYSWAGLAVGWVHQVVSLLLLTPYGRGRLLTTTFKLNDQTLAADAVAQAMFAGALALLGN
ncbi:MAG: glycoside hydrolase family 2 [Caldilineae bacterium]|nr:glycoside hydrolase family 2 [Caldilineae bacterium]